MCTPNQSPSVSATPDVMALKLMQSGEITMPIVMQQPMMPAQPNPETCKNKKCVLFQECAALAARQAKAAANANPGIQVAVA